VLGGGKRGAERDEEEPLLSRRLFSLEEETTTLPASFRSRRVRERTNHTLCGWRARGDAGDLREVVVFFVVGVLVVGFVDGAEREREGVEGRGQSEAKPPLPLLPPSLLNPLTSPPKPRIRSNVPCNGPNRKVLGFSVLEIQQKPLLKGVSSEAETKRGTAGALAPRNDRSTGIIFTQPQITSY
jgi:hypothetical protein